MEDMKSIKKTLAGFLYNVTNGGKYTGLPWSPFSCPEVYFISYTDEWDVSRYAQDDEFTEDERKKVSWQQENTSLWNTYYDIIGYMNLFLHESETAQGDEGMRDYVMGEAYAFRGYCFFKLLQYYAPYKNSEWGIPVCLESYEDFTKVKLQRCTQKEVYDQILSDIHAAQKLLERTPTHEGYNVMYSQDVLDRLEAQVYMYKAGSGAAEETDWENAAAVAGKAITGQILESDIDNLKTIFDCTKTSINYNPETCFRYTESSRGFNSSLFSDKYVSYDFYQDNFTEDNDIRKDWFYTGEYQAGTSNLKINKYNNAAYEGWLEMFYCHYFYSAFRLSESYLIRAEALAMSDQLPEAKEVLKTFKKARYIGNFTIGNSKEEFLEDVYRERRKEFLAETDIRWIDMKRLGVSVEREVEGVSYKLEKDDWRYTFPLPQAEIENNPGIKQNPGWILNY